MEPDNPQAQSISADSPIRHPKDDALGYAPFADQLAQSISSLSDSDGIVLAIHGPWGSGKSTVLNFVSHYLSRSDADERFLILRFNPWWFSGREDLTRTFFEQLRARLGDKDYGEVKARIADLADILSKLPYASGAEVVADKLRDQPDIVSLKENVGRLLRDSGHTVLVVIDDIDRLTASEIRDVFRTVKSVCNFPNVVYLLAFDKDVVSAALTREQGIPGRAYLEKIVQVPFELPLPDKAALRRLFFAELNEVLADTPEDDFDSNYWANVYFDGIDHFIDTPRDIVRVVNALRVTYPAVAGEINPVDFIAVESLRVFSPASYDVVRRRPHLFAGPSISHGNRRQKEVEKEEHDAWLSTLPEDERDYVVRLLRRIFPKFANRFGGPGHGSEWAKHWRKDLRVCSEEVFPVYFRLAVPASTISRAEMQTVIASAGDRDAFARTLRQLVEQHLPDGKTRLRLVLQRLLDYTAEDIPREHIRPICSALITIGDDLIRPEDAPSGMFDLMRTDWLISIHLQNLLNRLDLDQRVEVLDQAFQQSSSVSTIVNTVATLIGQQDEDRENPTPVEERVVQEEHLAYFQDVALVSIRRAVEEQRLLESPNLSYTLHRWKDWDDISNVRDWVEDVVEDDDGLIRFVHAFLSVRWVRGMGFTAGEGDMAARKYHRLDPKWIADFLDPDSVVDRLRRLADTDDIDEDHKTAANQFVQEYDIRAQGGDPDDLR